MAKKLDIKGIVTRTVSIGGGAVSASFGNNMLEKMIPNPMYRGGILVAIGAALPEIITDKKMKAYIDPFSAGVTAIGAVVLTNSFLSDDKKLGVGNTDDISDAYDFDAVNEIVSGTQSTFVGSFDEYEDVSGTEDTLVASSMQGV